MNKPFILCAEDNDNDIFLMQRVLGLKLPEYDCFFHKNCHDSINFLNDCFQNEQLPSLCLVDIKLINSNGLDLLKYIKQDQRFQHIPVIILSSSDRQDDKVKAQEIGCDEYVEKPKNYLDLKIKIPKIVHFWSKNKINGSE